MSINSATDNSGSTEGVKRAYQQYEVASMFGRLGGAWQEYNTRVAARYSLINMWLTASGLLLGAFAGGANYGPAITLLIGLALPSVAWAVFQMLFLHDVMLAKLNSFMQKVERHNNEDPSFSAETKLPSYHADAEFSAGVLQARGVQNITLRLVSLTIFLVQCAILLWVHVRPNITVIVHQLVTFDNIDTKLWFAAGRSPYPLPFLSAGILYAVVWYYADKANMNGIEIRREKRLGPTQIRKAFLRTVPPLIRWIVNDWWATHLSPTGGLGKRLRVNKVPRPSGGGRRGIQLSPGSSS